MPIQTTAVTRLGISGGIWNRLGGDYSGKAQAVDCVPFWIDGYWAEGFWVDGFWKTRDPVVPDVPVVAETSTGGWVFRREQERYRQEDEARQRKTRKAKARKIADKLDREIALAFIARDEGEAQRKDLERMTNLANEYKGDIIADNARIAQTIEDAVRLGTFSRMQKLARELDQMREEEEFLLLATKLLLEQ